MDPLVGRKIRLRPLLASDGPALVAAAAEGELWKLPYTIVPSAETIESYLATALADQAAGKALPFVTELLEPRRVIGSTRFWKIDPANRSLEIGWTWVAAACQRTFVNTEAKLLMLRHAFDVLDCIRVQFSTDETNLRSRAAILRLGAKEEGTHRHDFILPNGRKRSSVWFSILAEEWPAVRQGLEARLGSLLNSWAPD